MVWDDVDAAANKSTFKAPCLHNLTEFFSSRANEFPADLKNRKIARQQFLSGWHKNAN